MYIIKKKIRTKAGLRTYYCIASTVYKNGKPHQKILKYLGTADSILKLFEQKKKKQKK